MSQVNHIFFARSNSSMVRRNLNNYKHETLTQIWKEIEKDYPQMSLDNPNFILENIENDNRIHLDGNKTPHELELTLMPCPFICVE